MPSGWPRGMRPRPAPLPGSPSSARTLNDNSSVAAAVGGAWAVVNAVNLYVERGTHTFRSVHVGAAERIAATAARAGVARLVQLSAIGADPHSPSPYIRSRGEGEAAVRRAFPSAMLIRPAVMFGPGDALVTPLSKLLRTIAAGVGQARPVPGSARPLARARVCRRTLAGSARRPKPDRADAGRSARCARVRSARDCSAAAGGDLSQMVSGA